MSHAMPTATLARGLGRLARRTGRPLHLAVTDAQRAHPGISAEQVRLGWYAERDDLRADDEHLIR